MSTNAEPALLHVPKPAEILKQPGIVCLQDKGTVAWRRPEMVTDLSETGVTATFPPTGTTFCHATYCNSYRNQLLFGFHHLHALISEQLEFNCQEVENYEGRLQHFLAHEPPGSYIIPRITMAQRQYFVDFRHLRENPPMELEGHVFFGSPIEPANWGMWLLHGLQNAFSYVAAGQPGRYLCYAPSPWQQNLLKFMGVSVEKLIQQAPWTTYSCEEISLHQYSRVDLNPAPLTTAIFDSIVSRCCRNHGAAGPEKIFIGRKAVTRQANGMIRPLLNESDLEERLSASGYTVVEPETLPFEEQVRLFHGARKVVGLGGAGMFNTVFCKPDTDVISIEATNAFVGNHARLFSSMALRYGFIFGQQDSSQGRYPHNPWTLDIARAIEEINRF